MGAGVLAYSTYDYWIEFSGGSRLAIDAAKRILSGAMPDVAEGYLSLEEVQSWMVKLC